MIYQATSLTEALRIAEEMKLTGRADWFRGQTRDWPVLSSLFRRGAEGQDLARERLLRYMGWVKRTPQLKALAGSEDAMFAVAQHYRMPTNFVDFTTEPAVAAFFAAHDAPPYKAGDRGCIFCFLTDNLASVWAAVHSIRPNMPEPERLRLDIPELWRIQSQHGVFLFFPYDEGFERNIFDFDRVVFPAQVSPNELARLIPVKDIYPTQKSQLEIFLDQYFMLERMRYGQAVLDAVGPNVINFASLPNGFAEECFVPGGPPEHASWSPDVLAPWVNIPTEQWAPISKAAVIQITWPSDADPLIRRRAIADSIASEVGRTDGCRQGPVRWQMLGETVAADEPSISSALELLWDGLRRLPLSDLDLAEGLATAAVYADMVARAPGSTANSSVAESLAGSCLGCASPIEIEIGMSDGSYTRGFADPAALMAAVRDDFTAYLTDAWKAQIRSIAAVLQVATAPERVFDFQRLVHVFAREIAPTQVVLRGNESGRARLYNPVQAISIGLP